MRGTSAPAPLLRRVLQLRRSLAEQQQRTFAGCGGGASNKSPPPTPPPRPRGLARVAAVVAVASGKGGVGKSTVAANLAVALAGRHGLRVGLLDADIHGPSVPTMMNLSGKPPLQEPEDDEVDEDDDEAARRRPPEKKQQQQKQQPLMLPLENHGVRCMSMGFFTQSDEPVVWRGPIVSSAIDRFLHGTAWGALDALIVDMPPGTGDAQISLGQRLPLDGAVVVTTPQRVALLDARRGARMLQKVRVPLIGLVANMASFACGGCGREEAIFGAPADAERAAEELGCPVLGRVPLEGGVSAQSDAGAPVVVSRPESRAAEAFFGIAAKVAEALERGRAEKEERRQRRRREGGDGGGGGGAPKITMA